MLVDRSGSMDAIRDDAQGGLNRFLGDQRSVEGTCHFALAQFDTEYELLYDFGPIADAPGYTLTPRGQTALLDAIGTLIIYMIHKCAKVEVDKVIMVIQTDGQENASKVWNIKALQTLIAAQQELGWEFIFLGQGLDVAEQGEKLGMSSVGYGKRRIGETYSVMSMNTTATRSGEREEVDFTEEQRQQVAQDPA
jgi:hypothetical protein